MPRMSGRLLFGQPKLRPACYSAVGPSLKGDPNFSARLIMAGLFCIKGPNTKSGGQEPAQVWEMNRNSTRYSAGVR